MNRRFCHIAIKVDTNDIGEIYDTINNIDSLDTKSIEEAF